MDIVVAAEEVDHRDMENLLRVVVGLLSELSTFGFPKIELTELRHEEREDLLLAMMLDNMVNRVVGTQMIYCLRSEWL